MQNTQEPGSLVNSLITSSQESASAIAAKLSPPVSVVVAKSAGFTVSELIQYMTAVYVALLVVQKVWHLWDRWQTGRAPNDSGEDLL